MKQCDPGYIWDPLKNKCVRITGRYSGTWWGVYIDRIGKKKNGKNGNGNGNGNGSHNGNGSSNGNGGSNGGGNGNGGGGGGSEGRIRLPLKVEIPKNSTEFNLGLMF